MKIFDLEEIQGVLNLEKDLEKLLSFQKAAFIDFAEGLYEAPLPMQLIFPKEQGDCHVKGGFKKGSGNFVVKIANSSAFGGEGIVLIFSQERGVLEILLHDRGWLTTLRTALAGVLASEIVPWKVENIGIIGSGNLAKTLHLLLTQHYKDANIRLYARNLDKGRAITPYACNSSQELIHHSDLIFTATSSHAPVIKLSDVKDRKAIIGLGSDDEFKQEIQETVLAKSDIVIVDSKLQARKFGDVSHAVNSGDISLNQTIELGNALKNGIPSKIKLMTINLTGIAAQDIAMAEFILARLDSND